MSSELIRSSSIQESKNRLQLKRDLLILIRDFLRGEGFETAAKAVEEETDSDPSVEVCDNVDLPLILMDYVAYFQMRFHRKPKFTKKTACESNRVSNKTAKQPRKKVTKQNGFDHNNSFNEELMINGYNGCLQNECDFEVEPFIPQFGSPEMQELAQQISKEAMNVTFKEGWNGVIGHEQAKSSLEEMFLLPFQYPDIYAQCGLNDKGAKIKAALLSGAPGVGKTLLAKALAAEWKKKTNKRIFFLNLSASSLMSKWRGDSEKLVKITFALAKLNAPAVVFLDEADSIIGDRAASGEHEASKRCKSEFLTQLDGLNSESEAPVLFLAATNLIRSFDSAMKRRFDAIFELELPDKSERRQLIAKHIRLNDDRVMQQLIELSKGCSGSDIKKMIEEGKRKMFRSKIDGTFKEEQFLSQLIEIFHLNGRENSH